MKQHVFWKTSASTLLLALLMQGCGGGSSTSASAGSSPQLANGLVTGFGSVMVDGVEIEDVNASVVTENADGSLRNSVLQIGQRVRVNHDGKGSASKVLIDAAVIGDARNVDAAKLTLTVAGQGVSINTDAAAGPLTVWGGGYSSMANVSDGDLVEVHGSPVYDSVTSSYKVVATRVQKVTAIANLKVGGKISKLNTTAQTFSLNGLTVAYATATLRPNGATLADDMQVTAYGPTSGLAGTALTASHLKVNRLQDGAATDTVAQIGGQVSLFNSSTSTFEVQGVKVTVGSATTVTPTGAAVADNAYVKVSGTVGSDGSISATSIQVRAQNTDSDLAKVKLIGVISDFVDATSFVVRGIPVDASGINAATACPGVTLADNVTVQVTATQQANTPVVLATSLSCKAPPTAVIRPIDGVVSNLDSSAKTFVLTPNRGSATTVQWTDTTSFAGVTSAELASKQVRVSGYLEGGKLVARVVSVAGAGLDDDRFQRRAGRDTAADTSATEWDAYRRATGGNR
jgi:hypothetical protein